MNTRSRKSSDVELFKRSDCPVTNSLEIIGDKWTMVVIRDLFLGKKTYSDFQASPEGIPTNILADRLKRLQNAGVVDKVPYQDKPVRYEYRLTKKGEGLDNVLGAIKDWGLKYIPGTSAKFAEDILNHREQ